MSTQEQTNSLRNQTDKIIEQLDNITVLLRGIFEMMEEKEQNETKTI